MVGITNKTLIAEIRRQQQLSQSIVEGQTAISTGITLNKPSDNALAWVQVSEVGKAQAQQSAWQANVSYGASRAANAEANLEQVNTLLVRAQELVTSARNGSLNDSNRTAIVEEMSTIRATVASLLNQTIRACRYSTTRRACLSRSAAGSISRWSARVRKCPKASM
jgi:flagellar hook-associated protein 3 FlgL